MNILDAELLQDMAKNKTRAFEKLYLRYGQKLLEFVSHYIRSKDNAEEIVQSVFIKLWNKRHNIKQERSLKGYVFTIAYNEIKKAFLKKKRDNEIIQSYFLEYQENTKLNNDDIDYSELTKKIDTIVEQMPPKRKIIFKLRKKERLTSNEVAEYLKISEKTVKNQMTVAYAYIRKQINNLNC